MRVVYSIGATFAGGGIGTTAYHGVRGLYRHGMLARLLCTWCRPTEIPSSLVRTLGLVDRALRKAAVYDDTRHIHSAGATPRWWWQDTSTTTRALF